MELLISALISIAASVLVAAVSEKAHRISSWLVKCAARCCGKSRACRYEEEWLAHLLTRDGPWSMLWHAVGCLATSLRLGQVIIEGLDEVCEWIASKIVVFSTWMSVSIIKVTSPSLSDHGKKSIRLGHYVKQTSYWVSNRFLTFLLIVGLSISRLANKKGDAIKILDVLKTFTLKSRRYRWGETTFDVKNNTLHIRELIFAFQVAPIIARQHEEGVAEGDDDENVG